MFKLAHLKWFYHGSPQSLRWDLFFQPYPLIFTGLALSFVVIAWLLWLMRGKVDIIPGPKILGATAGGIKTFYSFIPLILAIHFAIPLIVNGVQGELFSMNNPLAIPWANFIGFINVFFAIALFYGVFTRICAAGLALLWFAGFLLIGAESTLENSYILGLCCFFFFAGRGHYALDHWLFPKCEAPVRNPLYAMLPLRIGVGISLVIVGFTEKLGNIPLAKLFLNEYPILNFTTGLFFPLSDELFILVIGATEIFVGLMIIIGAFPRLTILLALIPMNLTLTIFSWHELVGHLPFYAILGILLIWSSSKEDLKLFQEAIYSNTKY